MSPRFAVFRCAILVLLLFPQVGYADRPFPFFDIQNPQPQQVRVVAFNPDQMLAALASHAAATGRQIEFLHPKETEAELITLVFLHEYQDLSRVPGAVEVCAETCVTDKEGEFWLGMVARMEGRDLKWKFVFINMGALLIGEKMTAERFECMLERSLLEIEFVMVEERPCDGLFPRVDHAIEKQNLSFQKTLLRLRATTE